MPACRDHREDAFGERLVDIRPAVQRTLDEAPVMGLDRGCRALAAHRPAQPLGLPCGEAGEGHRHLDHAPHGIGQTRAEILLRQTDSDSLKIIVERGGEIGHGRIDRGRVARIETGHDVQQQRGVFRGARHRSSLIERGRERDHPIARHASVRRLEAGEIRERRRLADRAAGVGAGRGGRQTRGDRRGRTAGAASGNPFGIPRIFYRAII